MIVLIDAVTKDLISMIITFNDITLNSVDLLFGELFDKFDF